MIVTEILPYSSLVSYLLPLYDTKVQAGFPSPAEDRAPCNALFALRVKALLTWVKTVRELVSYLATKVNGDNSMVPSEQIQLKLFKL
jgi:hypothetical protein